MRHEDTGVVVERLPPGAHYTESDDDLRALAALMEALKQAQTLYRHSVRAREASELDIDRILVVAITAVNTARLEGVSPHT